MQARTGSLASAGAFHGPVDRGLYYWCAAQDGLASPRKYEVGSLLHEYDQLQQQQMHNEHHVERERDAQADAYKRLQDDYRRFLELQAHLSTSSPSSPC